MNSSPADCPTTTAARPLSSFVVTHASTPSSVGPPTLCRKADTRALRKSQKTSLPFLNPLAADFSEPEASRPQFPRPPRQKPTHPRPLHRAFQIGPSLLPDRK